MESIQRRATLVSAPAIDHFISIISSRKGATISAAHNHVQDTNRNTNNHLGRLLGIHLSSYQGGSQIRLAICGESIWFHPQTRASNRCHRDEECIEGVCQLEWRLGWLRRWIWGRIWHWIEVETVSIMSPLFDEHDMCRCWCHHWCMTWWSSLLVRDLLHRRLFNNIHKNAHF